MAYDREDVPTGPGKHSKLSVLVWLAVSTGWAFSIFTVIEELCLATACKDTASFSFFEINMGWLGIAYFSLIMVLLWLRRTNYRLNMAVAAMVFAGVGAEFRLLWIQKYVIGSWCPLCVTICCALLVAAILLLIEKIQSNRSVTTIIAWMVYVVIMVSTGLLIAVIGVKELI